MIPKDEYSRIPDGKDVIGFIVWQPLMCADISSYKRRVFDRWVYVWRGRSSCCFHQWSFFPCLPAHPVWNTNRVQFFPLLSCVQHVCFLICSCGCHFSLFPLYLFPWLCCSAVQQLTLVRLVLAVNSMVDGRAYFSSSILSFSLTSLLLVTCFIDLFQLNLILWCIWQFLA